MIKVITREISKLVMFTIAWAVPILLAKMFGNTHFLWFFFLSAILTSAVFSHFEDLEKIERFNITFDEDSENENYDERG